MKKLILMLATIGTFAFANAQQATPATATKPVTATPAPQTPTPDPNAPEIKWETKKH